MWLAPWFLLGLAGLALPVWLHRFARKTEEKHPFASSMFLEPSQIRRSRRHELRYWLLLLLRLALLALLALAFAGPLWRSVIKPGQGTATLHVIVLDTSMSMQRDGVWERAQERAQQLIGEVRGSSRAMIVAADHRLRVLVQPKFAADAGQLRAAVQSLSPGWSRLDYGALVAGSVAWGAGPGETVQLHVVSDLQQSASPLRFSDLAPPPGLKLVLEDVGAPSAGDADAPPANARIAGVREDPRTPGTVEVRIDGDALEGRSLVVEVNGEVRERRALNAGMPEMQRVALGEVAVGEHRLTARLEPADELAADDAWYTLLRRVEPKVLVVAADIDGDDARYFGAALQALERPRFDVERALPGSLATRQLADFAAIVISDAGLLNATTSEAVTKYVEAGGAVLMTLGARAAQQGTVPVSGAQLARGNARAAGNNPARISGIEQSHPVLREAGAWLRIRFFRHVPVVPPEDARVLLTFENGSPLMLEQTLGAGRLLLFASPLDRQWNDLAIHPLFVRFVAEATAWLAGARFDAASASVGMALDAAVLRRGGGQVFDPRGERSSMLGGDEQGSQRWVPELVGFYEVRGGGRSDFVAVNAEPRESLLTPLDEAGRERWLALQRPATEAGQAFGSTSASERFLPVWFWLLLAATALAFVEPLVANYHLRVQREA